MYTVDPAFVETFARACYDQGLSAKSASTLLDTARINELLETSPAFKEGFDRELKEAGVTPQE